MPAVRRRVVHRWLGVVCALAVAPAAAQLVTVDRVIDGDTVDLVGGERVRLIGIDTPEKDKSTQKRFIPAEPFYQEAKNFLHDLVDDKQVRMVVGDEPIDRYDRTLASLYLPDGTDVQEEILRHGYAFVGVYPPNLKHLQNYGRTEAEACNAKRKVWGHSHYALIDLAGLAADDDIRSGRGRVKGTVTSVDQRRKDVRLVLEERLTLLVSHGALRMFWNGRSADEFVGKTIIARGKVITRRKKKLMRIRHPFMLRSEVCADGARSP